MTSAWGDDDDGSESIGSELTFDALGSLGGPSSDEEDDGWSSGDDWSHQVGIGSLLDCVNKSALHSNRF